MFYPISLYAVLLFIVILMSCCSSETDCHENYEEFDYAEIGISDFLSYYPLRYGDRTYIDSIDQIFQGQKYSRSRPNHDYVFEDCSEARDQAIKDFNSNRPSIIQFNSINGESPYINDVYNEVAGLYIFNTGCYLYQFTSCYNDEILELLNQQYQRNITAFLNVIDSLDRKMVIDADESRVSVVDKMPTISHFEFDGNFSSNNTGVFCRSRGFLIGRYVVEVRKNGQARVLKYVEGSLDCECVEKVKQYFEKSTWYPALMNGDTVASIVQVQFIS